MKRAEEVRRLNRFGVDELAARAGGRLLVLKDLDALHRHFARSIATVVASNNQAGRSTVLILPYGPTGQYPLLREILNRERIGLRDSTFFFMDEHANASGELVPVHHPLSFRGRMRSLWAELEPELRPHPEQIIFPDRRNAPQLEAMIRAAGGIDVCYGGIGIHGHVAFNEPEAGVRDSGPRLVRLNDFTVTISSIRARVGGDLENYPRYAWTLGMRQCLGARRIELYCRNDVEGLDWANTVLRLAVLGEPGDDYPVTWIRQHPDWQVITDERTAASPENLL